MFSVVRNGIGLSLICRVQELTYTEVCNGFRSHSAQDVTAFEILLQKINENYAFMAPAWEHDSIPMATNEGLDVCMSKDGTAATMKSARFLPFDIVTISEALWPDSHSGCQTGSFRTVRLKDSGW